MKIKPTLITEKIPALTEVQRKIYGKVKDNWEKRVGKGNVDEDALRRIIIMADTDGDGKKRVVVEDKMYLVPIEDIILIGVKAGEIPDKYEEVR